MAVQWTEKQKDVIDTRERNILVSAAAGSGKTAVLVERIIQKILDKDKPVDVDKLLVVTFTKAAASEMRERVLEALEEALNMDPDNEHLQKQQTYIHNAKITTIDSFCAHVVREHFDKIELDPNTRIVDEAQMKMLESDVIEEMLEWYFENGNEAFFDLADQYTDPKKTGTLGELISQLYHGAMSHVNPKRWLMECVSAYDVKNAGDIENTLWMDKLKSMLQSDIDAMLEKLELAINVCYQEDGPVKYGEELEEIRHRLGAIDINQAYEEIRNMFYKIEFGRLPIIKKDTCDEAMKEQVKSLRDGVKKKIDSIKKELLCQNTGEMLSDIKDSKSSISTLIELTLEFIDRFAQAKIEKCIMDFSDQEHYAMSILVDFEEDGSLTPSIVAKDMASQFEEIMIDEYQDSNYIQEAILTSVANGFGTNNVFMVGDVKQSIYKFRLANPNLFIDKFNRYSEDLTKEYCKIILDKNFRSRREIIDSVNFIFEKIMHKDLGGIDYTNGNALSFGADYYPELPEEQDNSTEILLVDGKGNMNEALAVAHRIKELVNPDNGFVVTNKDGSFRTPQYKDIVILLRSVKGRADEYVSVLSAEGIPAYCESKTGYYNAKEVKTMIDYLSVIDNPLQDIPFASVMRSEIYRFSSEELAVIKAENDRYYFYDSAKSYLENGQDSRIVAKLSAMFDDINRYRKMVPYTSVYDMLNLILKETGYGEYISALPNGIRRTKNISILKEKAVTFDSGTYKGLFNFIRYLDKIKDLGMEEGEASPVSENDNIVRIMTFHKSKGLQFPIVFVCGLGTKFNNSDTTGKIAIHENFGVGADYMSDALKVKKPTMIKNIIHKVIKEENYAEYIRFLYVALTRAQEKMILTASDGDMEKKIENWLSYRSNFNTLVPYGNLMECNCMIDWIGMAVAGNKGFDAVAAMAGKSPMILHPAYKEQSMICSRWITEDETSISTASDKIVSDLTKEHLVDWDTSSINDAGQNSELSNKLSWKYSHEEDFKIPAKLSVTEIKKLSMAYTEDDESRHIYDNQEVKLAEVIPEFLQADEGDIKLLTGAERGTAYHRIFELFDFSMEPTEENVEKMIRNLVKCGRISENTAACVQVSDFIKFAGTDLYRRMKRAYDNNTLYRERSFMMGIPAKELPMFQDASSDEVILVQGIIDVCFVEDGKFIIADYKTDNVNSLQELIDKYAVQLESYKEAIERLDDIQVTEKIIYSVKLGQEICC